MTLATSSLVPLLMLSFSACLALLGDCWSWRCCCDGERGESAGMGVRRPRVVGDVSCVGEDDFEFGALAVLALSRFGEWRGVTVELERADEGRWAGWLRIIVSAYGLKGSNASFFFWTAGGGTVRVMGPGWSLSR